ncbi:MAG: type II toxin-antitoxin system HicA family toxin [Luteimonas sp.]|nr:type II toxin-antitoxin system HicA family toxin [Luteimonas sp.]
MSKLEKQIERLRSKPPPADVSWDELCGVLKRLGYELLKRKGSRRKFFNRQKNLLIICHQPHPNPDVDKGCVEDVVSHLIDNGIIEERSP